jgi:hypothetical protein
MRKKKLEIFLSCSGRRSTGLAFALNRWLPRVLKNTKPWVYNKIGSGKQWLKALKRKLAQSHVIILCLTPEDRGAPWILFEAGAIWGTPGERPVCSLLLDMSHKDLPDPLKPFQAPLFNKDGVKKLILDLNSLCGPKKIKEKKVLESFEENWPLLEVAVKKVRRLKIKSSTAAIDHVVKAFTKHIDSRNRFDGYSVYFDGGYETHAMYTVATDVARKRLYIFGRKNRKLFDKDHFDFFTKLEKRISQRFDLRILFLSPEAPDAVLNTASTDKNFVRKLKSCIRTARDVLEKAHVSPSKVCRSYRVGRPLCMMVVDEAVLCSPIRIDRDGRTQATTDAAFNIVSAQAGCGKRVLNEFLTQWDEADPLGSVSK